MLNHRSLIWAAFVLMVGSLVAYAGLNGVITGTISDNDGNAIPGVSVTISGENLQGTRTDFTNENGVFRVPEIPPGVYALKAEMMGLKTIEQQNVRVAINKTTKVKIVMEVAAFEETIVVEAAPSVLDVTTSTQTVNIERDFTEELPGGGSYQDAFIMVGGMTGGGNPAVKGSTKTDNIYLLDGVDTTDSLTGTFGSNLNSDAIEEIEVQTGGFQAEYGRAMGGIVNAITKSGGNKFSGTVRMEYENNSWEDDSHYSSEEPLDDELWVPTVSLGGPIVKDMLWFFVTWNRRDRDSSIRSISDPEDDPDNPSGTSDTSDVGDYPYAKITFQPTEAHKFVLKYNAEIRTIHGDNAGSSTTSDATNKQEQGGPFFGADWTWLVSESMFLETKFSQLYGFLNVIPEDENLDRQGYQDVEEGISWGNSQDYRENDRNRLHFTTALSYYLDEWIQGSHDLKFGLEYQLLEVTRTVGIPGNIATDFNAFQNGTDKFQMGSDYFYDEQRIRTTGGSLTYSGDYYALFAQDAWEVDDGLTLNLGLRGETMVFENDTGTVNTESYKKSADGPYFKTGTSDNAGKFVMIAPRLGMAWDINNSGEHKVTAFLGRYYNPFDLGIADMLVEQSPIYETYRRKLAPGADRANYEDRQYDWPDWELWDTEGGAENTNTIDPDIVPEYSDEIQLGYEREIASNVSVGIVGTYRATRDIIEDVGVWYEYENGEPTGRQYFPWDMPDNYQDHPQYMYDLDHYIVMNPEDAKRDYYGAELTFKANTSRFNFLASYTYALAKGTVYNDQPMTGGGYSSTGGVTHFSVYYDTPELSRNLYGKLPYDIDTYIKFHASYDFFPDKLYAFTLGASYFYRHGYSYDRRGADPTYGSYYSVEEYGRGTYRLQPISLLDLEIQKHFPVMGGKYGTFSVIGEVANAFSSEYLLQRNPEDKTPRKPWSFGSDGARVGPRSYTLSFKYTF